MKSIRILASAALASVLFTNLAGAQVPIWKPIVLPISNGERGPARINPQRLAVLRWYEANETLAPLTVDTNPNHLAFDGVNMWLAHQFKGVWKLDTETGATLCTIPPFGSNLSGIAFDGTRLWITSMDTQEVYAVDPQTCTVSAPVAVGVFPAGVAFDGKVVWVACPGSDEIMGVSTAGVVTNTVAFPAGSKPNQILFDGRYLWVSCPSEGVVRRVDPVGFSMIATPSLGVGVEGIVYDGRLIWASNRSTDKVVGITKNGNILHTVGGFNGPPLDDVRRRGHLGLQTSFRTA